MPDTAIIQTNVSQAVVSVTDVGEAQIVEVSVSTDPIIIETGVVGPQGPMGSEGYRRLEQMEDVDVGDRVDKSVVVYDASQSMFTVSSIYTIQTITDGGNF
jgi:hypothetical protein